MKRGDKMSLRSVTGQGSPWRTLKKSTFRLGRGREGEGVKRVLWKIKKISHNWAKKGITLINKLLVVSSPLSSGCLTHHLVSPSFHRTSWQRNSLQLSPAIPGLSCNPWMRASTCGSSGTKILTCSFPDWGICASKKAWRHSHSLVFNSGSQKSEKEELAFVLLL